MKKVIFFWNLFYETDFKATEGNFKDGMLHYAKFRQILTHVRIGFNMLKTLFLNTLLTNNIYKHSHLFTLSEILIFTWVLNYNYLNTRIHKKKKLSKVWKVVHTTASRSSSMWTSFYYSWWMRRHETMHWKIKNRIVRHFT